MTQQIVLGQLEYQLMHFPLWFLVPFVFGPEDFLLLSCKFCCTFKRMYLTSHPAFLCFVGEERFRYQV